jgi:hypothetical protein
VGSLKEKAYKRPHTLEELRYNIRREISTISGEEFQKVQKSSAVVLSAFVQEGNIFSTCRSTGNVLLEFLKVAVTANLLFASFTNC